MQRLPFQGESEGTTNSGRGLTQIQFWIEFGMILLWGGRRHDEVEDEL
jgi:hypothetical protein